MQFHLCDNIVFEVYGSSVHDTVKCEPIIDQSLISRSLNGINELISLWRETQSLIETYLSHNTLKRAK